MASGGRDDPRGISGSLKNGTVVPNRIFVGGISGNTNEDDLRNLFSKFGNVKATKIIVDKAGISRGYGFVTFETEEEAQKILLEVECLTLKDRKLNIASAIKKQPYNRTLESNSVHNTSIVWPTQPYSGTPAGFSRESVYYPQGSWPLMWHQQLYLQQQCQYPQAAQTGYPQYVYSVAPVDYPYPSSGAVAGSDYSETSSADSGESIKNRSKATTSTPLASDYDRSRSTQIKPTVAQSSNAQRYSGGNNESPANYVHPTPMHQLHHPVFVKTANGISVMAYPGFVMGSPAMVQVRDGNGESDNVLTELGFLHSPIASGALTPPPTPLASIPCDFGANTSIDHLRKN